MSNWTDGYIADVTYTSGYYRETSPAWLSLAAVLLGHRPPSLAKKFRWCELGCGQAWSTLAFAAAHPGAEFYGFDFNPGHIDNAQRIAERAGLGNVHLADTSFADLAESPKGAVPQMDFIVLHGIWSWVTPIQRANIIRFIDTHLAPGGLVYVSYNNLAGWASMVPMQRLMKLWGELHPAGSVEAASTVMNFVKELTKSDGLFFPQNPTVAARLETAGGMDPRYIAHEYLNGTWEPASFDSVSGAFRDARCSYVGSATLTDNIDGVAVPPGIGKMVQTITDVRLKESIRDLGAARAFRRDIYRRGSEQPVPGEHLMLMEQIVMTGLGREKEKDIQIPTGIGQVVPRPEIYGPVLERLTKGPLSFAELRNIEPLRTQPLAEVLQVVAFLATGSLAHPTPNTRIDKVSAAPALALNREIGLLNERGANLPFLVSPRLGNAINVDVIEAVLLPDLVRGPPPNLEPLVQRVLAVLAQTGRSTVRDGKVITDPAEALASMTETVARVVKDRLPVLQRLGILGA